MHIARIITACVVPVVVSALTLHIPSNRVIGAQTNITWVTDPNDWPRWTLFFMGTTNPFDLRSIIAEDVDPSIGYITTTFPVDRVKVGEPYVVKAVNVTNVDWVLANSPIFTLTAT